MTEFNHPYPAIPYGAQTGLLLFGAYFKGRNDGRFFLESGLTATVVDNNPELLAAMQQEYPSSWKFVLDDAFSFMGRALEAGRRWDVVSADPSLPEEPRVLTCLNTLQMLSTRMTVVGMRHEDALKLDSPWTVIPDRESCCGEPWSWAVAPTCDYLLAPHNDDETLFASYICQRFNPLVIVCLRSFHEAQNWNPIGPDWKTRELETSAALKELGIGLWDQWDIPDTSTDWRDVSQRMLSLTSSNPLVWAPMPEEGGHPHHNMIGTMARNIFDRVQFYATYTDKGKTTTPFKVIPSQDFEDGKLRAMRRYVSQREAPQTRAAFTTWSVDEYTEDEYSQIKYERADT